jgi:protein NEDD1
VSLTSLAFSPEGAALYVGTEQGKLLVLDLRALEKEPVVLASQDGEQIIGINIMVRFRTSMTLTLTVIYTTEANH